MVIPTIFNNIEPYQITNPGNYYPDLSPTSILPSSTLANYQFLLYPHDNYSQATNPPSSLEIPSLDSIVSKNDPIDRFLNSKKDVLLNSTRGILEQIYERLALRDSNIYELDQRISRANSVLDQLDVFELGSLPVIDKRKSFFEKDLMTFEQEKRFEKVACWRDISRLQGQLLEIKQQIDTQANRQELIGD